jgi:DNA-directed RNA polymerase specialized sigma24 family protein
MALGQYTVSSPDKLRALLTRMVHNKVVDLARRPESRLPRLSSVSPGVVLPEPGDSGRSQLSDMLWRDACKRILARFSDSERHVSEMRAQGRTWEEVGATLGEKPNTVRVRFERAVKRVTRGLGLEELVYG